MKITLTMPKDLTHYVLCSALESSCGSAFWASEYPKLAKSKRDKYLALAIADPDKGAECDIKPKNKMIGDEQIAAALGLMLTDPDHAECAARVLAGRGDAPDADRVLQFAVFGAVVYG